MCSELRSLSIINWWCAKCTPWEKQYSKIVFINADVSVQNWLVATNMSMSLGNIYPSYDAIQLLIGWEFYVFASVGVNVCKK